MKPKVLVARWVFPDIVDRLREHFDVDDNPEDVSLTKDQLIARLKDKAGALTTGGDRGGTGGRAAGQEFSDQVQWAASR